MKYALTHATILDGTTNMKPRPNMTVLVDDDTITAIQSSSQPLNGGYETVDLEGKYLLPGMINMHAHMFGTGKPSKELGSGWQQRAKIKVMSNAVGKKILNKMVLSNAQMALYSGVTTLRCVGDFHYSDVITRNAINAGKAIGPRMIVSGPALTVTNGHGDGTFGIAADDPWRLRYLTRNNIKHGVDFIKICITGGVMDSTIKGKAGLQRMTEEEAAAICDEAHRAGMIVASHTESTEGVRAALKAGVDSIEHGAAMDDEIIKLYKSHHAFTTMTISPAIPMAKLDPSVSLMSDICQYNSNIILQGVIDSAKQALENDIPLALGTDAACPFAMQYNVWRELAYMVKYVGVTPKFALWTATLNNAQLLGIGDKTGSIEVGKCADLFAIDGDPLTDIRQLSHVSMVMTCGKLINNPDPHRLPDVEKTLDELL